MKFKQALGLAIGHKVKLKNGKEGIIAFFPKDGYVNVSIGDTIITFKKSDIKEIL